MSRFLVFAGDRFYPGGGWHDFHSAYETAEGAVATAKQIVLDRVRAWSHVADSVAKKEIQVFSRIDTSRRSEVWMFGTFDIEADGEGGFANGVIIDQGDRQ